MLIADALGLEYEALVHFTPTAEQRRQFASSGYAMPDGSFYIRPLPEGSGDLDRAIQAVGRATPNAGESDTARRNAVRRHIMKRARALKQANKIPDTWNSDGTLKQSAILIEETEAFLESMAHFGVLGMHWGVRRGDNAGAGGRPPISPEAARAAQVQAQIRKSGMRTVTNDDLQALVTRMNLESQYSNLDQRQVSSGRKFVSGIIRDSGKQLATQFVVKNAPKAIAFMAGKVMVKAVPHVVRALVR